MWLHFLVQSHLIVIMLQKMDGEDENPLLDELIRVLDDEDPQHVPDVHQEGELEARVPDSPHNRPRLVKRYVSSSSAKRREVKNGHCNFCDSDLSRSTLEDHLNATERCRVLYCRRAHLKTVPAVMVKMFSCLYCDAPANKLQVHLRSTPECRDQYYERFGVDSVE